MDTPGSIYKDAWALVLLGGGVFIGFIVFKLRSDNAKTTTSAVTSEQPIMLPNGTLAYKGQNWVTAQSCSAAIASATAGP